MTVQEKEKLQSELLNEIKLTLPNGRISISSGLCMLNGLALMYKKSINDFSGEFKMICDTKIKAVLSEKHEEELAGVEINFKKELEEYFSLLPGEFSSLINREVLLSLPNRKALEEEISRLAVEVLKHAVKIGLREEEAKFQNRESVLKLIEDYKSARRVLKAGLALEIKEKKGEEAIIQVTEYLKFLADKIIENEVEYCDELSENVIRLYSSILLGRDLEKKNNFDERDMGYEELERY